MTDIVDPLLDQNSTQNPFSVFFEAFFERSTHAFILLDAHHQIIKVNPAFRTMFFFYGQDFKGQSAQDVFRSPIDELIDHGTQGSVQTPVELTLYDGLSLPRKVAFLVTPLPQIHQFLLELIDYTESNRLIRAAQAIKECQLAMQRDEHESVLMHDIVNIMIEIGHYRFAFIGLIQEDEAQTVQSVAHAGHEDGYLSQIRINLTEPKLRNGPSGRAIQHRIPTIIRNTELDPTFAPWAVEALKRGYNSMISLPLLYLDQPVIGVMNLYAREVNAFDLQEVELLTQLVASLTFGLMMRRTQNALLKTTQILENTVEKMRRIGAQTVGALAATVEFRDPYTAGHQRRVTQLAQAIAEEMNLGDDKSAEIAVAASLHDIGKVTVPNEILSKPGKISEIEMRMIRTHSQAGYDIIKDIEFTWPIAQTILQHHERLDGSGYPNGLKDQEILLTAKIIAVADVMEAMVSHRPYRPGLGLEVALNEIRSKRGIQYDESVVDACLSLFEKKHFSFD